MERGREGGREKGRESGEKVGGRLIFILSLYYVYTSCGCAVYVCVCVARVSKRMEIQPPGEATVGLIHGYTLKTNPSGLNMHMYMYNTASKHAEREICCTRATVGNRRANMACTPEHDVLISSNEASMEQYSTHNRLSRN